jgi:NAD(P)-dependent dehydrogenase (short-subunit alcohol dehydrogenase family)
VSHLHTYQVRYLTGPSDAFVNNLFQVNLFGPMHVTQAILPFLREQGHGVVAFTSSSSGWAPLPFMSHYAASKAALSTYVEVLHRELRTAGINCVCIEPGGFATNLGQYRGSNQEASGVSRPGIAAYEPLFKEFYDLFMGRFNDFMPGDLARGAARIVDVVKREGIASGKPWTVRVALGSDGMGFAKQKCEAQLKSIDMWKDVSLSTNRDDAETDGYKQLFKFTAALGTEI